ncbi:hypothetical protein [Granulicella paludicola]|uniref:hypothetical protein n=1 Tax=Granulicella paludicola TaxID=474951 RepID=UPI0021DFF17C|nr:hypothetical protein [Granulicella paludicola]
MENWKRIVLKAAGFGGGLALVGAIILGVCVWWSSRPPKPKPWNTGAITAQYEDVRTQGDNNTLAFDYTLVNNTDHDYHLTDATGVHIAAHLRRSNALSFDDSGRLKTDYPIYVPAHSRVRFPILLEYPIPVKDDSDAPVDVRHDNETKLAKYIVENLSNIDGLVLMDDNARYQINFPDGWTQRAKEPLRVKSPDTSK